MSVQLVAQTIQFILAPVVMITATALLLNGLLGRYAAVNDRIRAMAHERLELLRALAGARDRFEEERLGEIDAQLPLLVRRHGRLHDAVLSLYVCVVVFVASMFAIGLAAAIDSAPLASVALATFLAATAILLLGLVLAVTEVVSAQRAIEYEVGRVSSLKKPRSSGSPPVRGENE